MRSADRAPPPRRQLRGFEMFLFQCSVKVDKQLVNKSQKKQGPSSLQLVIEVSAHYYTRRSRTKKIVVLVGRESQSEWSISAFPFLVHVCYVSNKRKKIIETNSRAVLKKENKLKLNAF